jgi:peptidoglycan/LPS O-acetylase OafA/YrhL
MKHSKRPEPEQRVAENRAHALPSRLLFFDAARGFAAIIVVLSHWKHFFYVGTTLPNSFSPERQPLHHLLQNCYDKGGGASVQFFFVLSGFIFFWLYAERIAAGQCTFIRFLGLRFARLYPLHAITLVAVCGLQAAWWREWNSFFVYEWNDAYHFALNSLFIQHWGFEKGMSFNGPSWSISTEIALYLLFFALAYVRVLSLRATLLIVIAAHLAPKFFPGNRWSVPIETFFLGGVAYYVLAWYVTTRSTLSDAVVLVAAASVWIPQGVGDHLVAAGFGEQRVRVFVVFPITVAALLVADLRWPLLGTRFSWLGDLSYSTYLLHFPLQLICVFLATTLGYQQDVFYSPYSLFLFLAILVALSVASYHLLEKPLQSQLRRALP